MKNRYFFPALFLFIAAHFLQAQPVLVKNISRQATNFTALGNLLFYTSNDSLFKSDGTAGGTVFIKAGINGPTSLKAHNGLLYFITTPNYDLWRSNGTASGTYILSSPNPSNKALEYWGESGTKLFFTKSDATYGTELFITDGTVSGTSLLKDIYTGSSSSSPRFLGKIGSALFFSAINLDSSSIAQSELWKTDGTTSGTVMVKDINPSGGSIPSSTSSAVTSTHLFFLANDGIHGTELWKSDGTSIGTVLVKDIVPGTGGGYEYYEGSSTIILETPTHITEAGGSIFFMAGSLFGPGHQTRLWKSDGTDSGTIFLNNINSDQILSTFELNNKLIIHSVWSVKSQIWRSDGTPAGTIKLKDNNLGGDNYYEDFYFTNNNFLFSENYQGDNYSFWKVNGEPSGTSMIAGLYSSPGDVETAGNNLFYTAHGEEPNYEEDGFYEINELWRVNLSTSAVTKIKDIAGISFAGSGNLTDVNGTLYFTSLNRDFTPGIPVKLWKYEVVPYVPPVTIVPSGLVLVNADTDADIRNLNNIDTVCMNQNVAVRSTVPTGTSSIRFYINNVLTRTENSAPYALNGDASGDFSPWNKLPGLYTITAIAYTGSGGTGTAIDTMTSQIRVPLIPDPITFILVDANTDTDIRTMVKGEVISIPASAKITIRVEPTSAAQSIVFSNNGRIENSAPYSLAGDSGGDYYEWTNGTTGSYILIVNAYSGANGTGNLIQSDTIYFAISRTSSKIAAYPNPANDHTIIETENAGKEEAEIQLTDNFGRIYLQQKVIIEAGSNTIPVNTNSLPVGIYFLKISGETEQRVVKIYKQ